MRKRILFSLFVFIFIIFCPSFVHSDSHYKYVNSPKTEIYFGHISYVEVQNDGKDPVVLGAENPSPEIAVLNFPLAPGDTIKTTGSRRCEIQFDTGTIIRLDLDTELKIETILAHSLSSSKKITNLVLVKGQIYIMYKRYNRPEVFQVITPNAAVKMNHSTVALIKAGEDDSTEVQIKKGKAYVLCGPDEENTEKMKLKKSQKLTVLKDHFVLYDKYRPDVDFELWNEHINENFEALHEGKNFIPKPIEKYPKAVMYFAQKYSNLHGEWIWNSLYGYVWRPFYNDKYPWGNWSPYINGQWRKLDNQLFWVPQESWGWVPYHLGLWTWDKKSGWIWIPGDAFAPAWAAWDFYMGYYSWRPWCLWDWFLLDSFYGGFYGNSYYSGYYYPQFYGGNTGYLADNRKPIFRKIHKDQLEQKGISSYPLPKKMKKAYANVVSALKKGDERVFDSLKKIPEQMVIIKKEDLNASRIQNNAIKFSQFSPNIQKEFLTSKFHKDTNRQAVDTFRRNNLLDYVKKSLISSKPENTERITAAIKEHVFTGETALRPKKAVTRQKTAISGRRIDSSGKKNAGLLSQSRSKVRFRDWNPDIRAAQRAGVSIRYSSRTNEVFCPELRISSRGVFSKMTGSSSRVRIGSSGVFSSSGSISSSSSGSGSTGTRSSVSRSSARSSSSGGSGGSGKKK